MAKRKHFKEEFDSHEDNANAFVSTWESNSSKIYLVLT